MGNLACCKKNKKAGATYSQVLDTEPEISIPSFSSKNFKYFKEMETKFNIMKPIPFTHFLFSLKNFTLENATLDDDYNKSQNEVYSKNSPFLDEVMNNDIFQTFIEHKMFKHPDSISLVNKEENIGPMFSEYIRNIHKALKLKLSQNDKANNIESDDEDSRIKKVNIICFGILFCSKSNISKVKYIFDLFSSEEGCLEESDRFKEFLLSLFLIPNYCSLDARRKMEYTNLEKIDMTVVKSILDTCELKDSLSLLNYTIKTIFEGKPKLTYNEFKEKFTSKDKGIGFMLSPEGIRFMQEECNA